MVLASARLSERSTRRYASLGVFRQALAPVRLAAAQTREDGQRGFGTQQKAAVLWKAGLDRLGDVIGADSRRSCR